MIMYSAEVCGKVLYELNIPHKDILKAKNTFLETPLLIDILSNPTITKEEKCSVIDKVFPDSIKSFIKGMCSFGHIKEINSIFEAYEDYTLKLSNTLKAELIYVNKPTDIQIEKFCETLKKKYNVSNVNINLKQDTSLIGGYILKVGDVEFNKSIQGTLNMLQHQLVRR